MHAYSDKRVGSGAAVHVKSVGSGDRVGFSGIVWSGVQWYRMEWGSVVSCGVGFSGIVWSGVQC